MTKTCSYAGCGERREHWSNPDAPRKPREVDVNEEHVGPVYCSLECAAYDGAYSVKKGWLK